jgi:hypothetical protein
MEEPKRCSIFSNTWHFAVYVGRMGVACPLPAFGGSTWYNPRFKQWLMLPEVIMAANDSLSQDECMNA